MRIDQRVAVLGATGFVGRHLLAELHARSIPVILPRSRDGRRLDIAGPVEEVIAAMADATVVVNAAGTAHKHSPNPADFWAANTIGARNVAHAVAATPSTKRLVHVSSVAVGAGGLEPPVADYQPFTAYGASKAAGELAVAAELGGYDKELVVVRPAGIGGDGSPGAWGKIRRFVAAGRRVPVPDSNVRHNVVEIEEVVDLLVSAITGVTQPGVFSLAGPRPVTIAEYVGFVGQALGVEPRTVNVPHWALSPMLAITSATEASARPLWRTGQLMSTLSCQRPLVDESPDTRDS